MELPGLPRLVIKDNQLYLDGNQIRCVTHYRLDQSWDGSGAISALLSLEIAIHPDVAVNDFNDSGNGEKSQEEKERREQMTSNEVMRLIDRERSRLGLSQKDMSLKCGFGENTYSTYLNGVKPSFDRVDLMLRVVGLRCTIGEVGT